MMSPVVMKMLSEARMDEIQREAEHFRNPRQAESAPPWNTFPLALVSLLLAAIGGYSWFVS